MKPTKKFLPVIFKCLYYVYLCKLFACTHPNPPLVSTPMTCPCRLRNRSKIADCLVVVALTSFVDPELIPWPTCTIIHVLQLCFRYVFKKSSIYTLHNLYPSFDFDASDSQKLHCFEITHTKQCYTISKLSLK